MADLKTLWPMKCNKCGQTEEVQEIRHRFYIELRKQQVPCDSYLDGLPCDGELYDISNPPVA